MTERATYTADEVDAAVAALADPDRLRHGEEVVTHAAPALQRILEHALHEGGWYDGAHAAQVQEAAAVEDADGRARAIDALVQEETRLGMLVGLTVGFELARELDLRRRREET